MTHGLPFVRIGACRRGVLGTCRCGRELPPESFGAAPSGEEESRGSTTMIAIVVGVIAVAEPGTGLFFATPLPQPRRR